MRITLAGPIQTAQLAARTGLPLDGLPPSQGPSPVVGLAGDLLDLGHEVTIATLDPTIDAPLVVQRGALTIRWAPFRGAPRYRARVRSRDLFAREIEGVRAAIVAAGSDIVHAHWTYEYAEAALRSRRPMLATMHDTAWRNLALYRDPYRLVRLMIHYRAMARIPHLTVVAPFMATGLWRYGYSGEVDVVPNGFEIPAAAPDRAIDLARPILVTTGDRGRRKNVQASLAAFDILKARIPGAELHLFGAGLDAGLAVGRDGVVGHGHVPNPVLMRFLSERATLMIHPALLECCPMVVGEAKARGVPCIGGAASGGVGFVIGAAGGALVDIRRPAAIADAAAAILSDRETYLRHAEAARADMLARFRSMHVTERYLSIYARILG